MSETLLQIIAILVPALIAQFEYNRRLNRAWRKDLERENEILRNKSQRLTSRVADLETKVNELEKYRALYQLIEENHKRLKHDHEELKTEVAELRKSLDQEQAEKKELLVKVAEYEVTIKQQEIEIRTYKSALALIGERLNKQNNAELIAQDNTLETAEQIASPKMSKPKEA